MASPADSPVIIDTDTQTPKVTIDPDGDVVLVLDGAELQVSSKALGLASSVFKVMFGPQFREGRGLNAASPKRISLPEDNAVAMTTLCNIIHHQSHKVHKTLHPFKLVEIGILCDKYDCSEALESWSKTWLGFYQQDGASDIIDMTRLLYPYYVFNDLDSFKQISMLTVYHTTGFLSKPETTGSLPDGVLELLHRKKWEIECQLSVTLATMVGPILDLDYELNRRSPAYYSLTRCEGDGQRLWRHLRELRRLGLWPLAAAFVSSTISTVCKNLEKYEEKPRTKCACPGCSIDYEQAVRKAGSDAMQSFKGLCLNCIRLGTTKTGEFRECSVHKKTTEGSDSAKKIRKKG